MENEKTIGEERVRIDFNVGGDTQVDTLKTLTAELINLVNSESELDPRLAALAMTAYEEACMWGVKLVTTNK